MMMMLLACAPEAAPDRGWMIVHRCLDWGPENTHQACTDAVRDMGTLDHVAGTETDWCWVTNTDLIAGEDPQPGPFACHECGDSHCPRGQDRLCEGEDDPACSDQDPIDWHDHFFHMAVASAFRADALFVVELKDSATPETLHPMASYAVDAVMEYGLQDHVAYSAFDDELRSQVRDLDSQVLTAQNEVTNPLPLGLGADPYLIINTGTTTGAQLVRAPPEVEVILYNVDTPHTRGHAFDLLHSGAAQYLMANSVWEPR